MLYIDKRLTGFVWYAPALDLRTGSYSWKQYIRSLRRINPAGAGFVSFDPARPANSLTVINTGDVLTLDALSIPPSPGYFELDNGTAPVPRPTPDILFLPLDAGGPDQLDYAAQRIGKPVFINDLGFSGTSVVTWSVNGGAYVSYDVANQQIAALDPNLFGSLGAGYTLQARVTRSQPTGALDIRFILNY